MAAKLAPKLGRCRRCSSTYSLNSGWTTCRKPRFQGDTKHWAHAEISVLFCTGTSTRIASQNTLFIAQCTPNHRNHSHRVKQTPTNKYRRSRTPSKPSPSSRDSQDRTELTIKRFCQLYVYLIYDTKTTHRI